jgi:hypothetical protein
VDDVERGHSTAYDAVLVGKVVMDHACGIASPVAILAVDAAIRNGIEKRIDFALTEYLIHVYLTPPGSL